MGFIKQIEVTREEIIEMIERKHALKLKENSVRLSSKGLNAECIEM